MTRLFRNKNPVIYSGFVSSSRGQITIPQGQFEAKEGRQQTIKVQADESGQLTKI